jgi:hypothetical protein
LKGKIWEKIPSGARLFYNHNTKNIRIPEKQKVINRKMEGKREKRLDKSSIAMNIIKDIIHMHANVIMKPLTLYN